MPWAPALASLPAAGRGVDRESAIVQAPAADSSGGSGRIARASAETSWGNPEGDDGSFAMDPDGSDVRPPTSNGASDRAPAWSPHARKTAFVSFHSAPATGRVRRWPPTGAVGQPRAKPQVRVRPCLAAPGAAERRPATRGSTGGGR